MNIDKRLCKLILCTILACPSCIHIDASAKPTFSKMSSSNKPNQTNSAVKQPTPKPALNQAPSFETMNLNDNFQDSTPKSNSNNSYLQQPRPLTPTAIPVEYAIANLQSNHIDQGLPQVEQIEQVEAPIFTHQGQRINSSQRSLPKLQQSELDIEQELHSTLRRQNISQPKSAADTALIIEDTTTNYLRSQTPTTLVSLLTSAPQQALENTQITRSKVWSAITANIADSLGITSTNKFISAQVKKISDSASKTLDMILGDRTVNNGITETRINQLISNTTKTLQNLTKNMATRLQDVPTHISDILSGSATTIHRDEQGTIIGKTVEKLDDSTIHYNTAGKISSVKTSNITGIYGNNAMQEQYTYDPQGKLSKKKASIFMKQN